MKMKRFEMTGVIPRPEWWLVRPDEIETVCRSTVKGKCTQEAVTPAGFPVLRVIYGDYPQTGNPVNWSSALGTGTPEIFGRQKDEPQTVLMAAGIHGCEIEGVILLLNLISLLEKGVDLRGKPRPELVEGASHYRLVLFPCVNMDGRAISPDHRLHADLDECRRAGGGWWKDGTTIRWPKMKEFFPLPLDQVGYPGGYPNSEGYNIQHDASPGNIRTEEARAILRAAEEKCADLFLNFHSHPVSPDSIACGPQIYAGPANIAVGKELAKRCNRALTALDYPFDEKAEIEVTASFNLNTAVQFCCGAPAITFEIAGRDNTGFDRILETGYLWLETIFEYGQEKPFCDRAGRKKAEFNS
ncbi:MAG: hypothetical protein E7055_09355 [Lentisphaerae bacterium]|nr:hypothetical protein [Lentisphaerota bacterium]